MKMVSSTAGKNKGSALNCISPCNLHRTAVDGRPSRDWPLALDWKSGLDFVHCYQQLFTPVGPDLWTLEAELSLVFGGATHCVNTGLFSKVSQEGKENTATPG